MLASLTKGETFELENWLPQRETWMTEREEYMQVHSQLKLRWVSDTDQRTAHATQNNFTFLEHPVEELQIRFDDRLPLRINLVLYTIGHQGFITEHDFQRRLQAAKHSLNSFLNSRPGDRETDRRGRVNVYQRHWEHGRLIWTLRWSETPGRRRDTEYRPEFIMLNLRLRDQDRRSDASASRTERIDLSENVVRNDNGDVYIDNIPMVDQGDRGYCAVASLERVLQYYQVEVDQHELAQLAQTTAQGGTNPQIMFEALKQAGPSLGIYIRDHEEMDIRELQQIVSRYNRIVRRREPEQIELGRVVNLAALYSHMDYPSLKEARTQRSSQLRVFLHTVKRDVDRGIPLLWSCMLGVGPGTERYAGASGHLRLIIGYNEDEQQIIYSDSWGSGHEKKYIPLDRAWTITTGLHTARSRTHR